jgi:hypothetical protein
MHPQTIFLFIDGLGIGEDDPAVNPLLGGNCPTLVRLMREQAVPVDATLDIEGLPQSATGQTTLLTGVNGAKVIGRHKEGFPNAELRAVVRNRNLFDLLRLRGYRCTFANAYYLDGLTEEQIAARQSVTTVMTLHALGEVRQADALDRGEAVYNDLTRERLRARGYAGDLITPEEAGEHLIRIAAGYDLTLFEFFLTDLVAHKGTPQEVQEVLHRLDRFLSRVVRFAEGEGKLVMVCSDHGNIEDATTRTHTRNPVPLIAVGEGADRLRQSVQRLEDVVPALLARYPANR